MQEQDIQLEMPDEFVRPNYLQGSIANIPATVAALLDAPFEGLPPLPGALWRPLGGDVKRVVTFVVDGLGWNLLQQERPFLQPLLQQAKVEEQLTSIFPSTTAAALSSLWTGVAPAQHSLVGLSLFFPEYGTIGQLLNFSPTFGRYPDALVEAGLSPEAFLQWPGLAQQLASAGVPAHAFKGWGIVNSALSKMHGRGVAGNHGVTTLADMLVQMRRLLEATKGERLYAAAYWPTVDTLGHEYGWNDETVAAELRSIVMQLQTEFLDRLSEAARRDTVLLICADHGQIVTPLVERIYIEDHPQLQQMLFMKAAGEPRVVYLYTKHGCQENVATYINEHLGEAMIAWPASDILGAGLLGPQPFDAATAERIGDVVVVMRGGHALLDSRTNDQDFTSRMLGRHGGMTHAEMIVPWLGFRLDDM
jgi:hypothetical protein